MATVESSGQPYSRINPARYADQEALLNAARDLYRRHGIEALATHFLERQRFNLYHRLLAAGFKQAVLLERLGLTEEYTAWRKANRKYRGVIKPTWSWEVAVAKARELVAQHGDLPTVEWCHRNGLSSLFSAVNKAGRIWEDLRVAVGLPPTRNFCESANGMRWLSQPEALLSDFLHARGVEHKRGERYPADYEEKSGRKWGRYDLHFRSKNGAWIDVEVWGEPLDRLGRGRYRKTKALKEQWHGNRPNFLGISYKDCHSQTRLARILEPYIGDEPVARPSLSNASGELLTSNFATKAELLETCRALAAQMPDGVFPGDSWLRKRGKHADRDGPAYNSLAIYVTRWFGGTRAVRELLGQGSASTTKWTLKIAKQEWDGFVARTGLTPSQCRGPARKDSLPPEVRTEAARIHEAIRRNGWLEIIRDGASARRITWTPEHTRAQWQTFVQKHGRTPSQCMSAVRRRTLPRAVTDEATRIYDAARRLGMLAELRGEVPVSRALQQWQQAPAER